MTYLQNINKTPTITKRKSGISLYQQIKIPQNTHRLIHKQREIFDPKPIISFNQAGKAPRRLLTSHAARSKSKLSLNKYSLKRPKIDLYQRNKDRLKFKIKQVFGAPLSSQVKFIPDALEVRYFYNLKLIILQKQEVPTDENDDA